MTLTSPSGTVATVTDDNGGSIDDAFNGTQWSAIADLSSTIPYTGNPNIPSEHTYIGAEVASTLTPMESFAVFDGENPNGIWTLTIKDDAAGDTGNLSSWSLAITTCAPDADADGTADSEDSCSGTDTDANSNGTADCLESDLRPVSLTAKRVNGKFQCSFFIQNFGPVAAAASSAQIRFGVASDSIGKTKQTFTVPALAAGAKSSKLSVNKAGGNARYCRFVADSADVLSETNETNNEKSKIVR